MFSFLYCNNEFRFFVWMQKELHKPAQSLDKKVFIVPCKIQQKYIFYTYLHKLLFDNLWFIHKLVHG